MKVVHDDLVYVIADVIFTHDGVGISMTLLLTVTTMTCSVF